MTQVKVEAFIAIDEHGNYRIVGTSQENQTEKMIALVRDEIQNDLYNTKVTSFKVVIDLPEPKTP